MEKHFIVVYFGIRQTGFMRVETLLDYGVITSDCMLHAEQLAVETVKQKLEKENWSMCHYQFICEVPAHDYPLIAANNDAPNT